MDELFKGYLPEGEQPDIQIYIFPLKVFMEFHFLLIHSCYIIIAHFLLPVAATTNDGKSTIFETNAVIKIFIVVWL